VTIEDRRYRIVAALAPQDTVSPVAPDGAVLLPPDVFRADGANQVVVRTDSAAAAGEVATRVRASLNARVERVNVLELSAIIERIGRFFALLNTFLIAVGAVSLLVAGVSILNVMLMSVNERRAEIGVLRAVGVRRRAVLRTILAEAALLGVAGASLGVALSVLVAAALYLGVPEVGLATVANLRVAGYLALAFGFGVVVSLASGAYPAWRAADADPVESLRGP
jgi:putative ABC transport system permease protein